MKRFIDNADVAQYSATIDESYHEVNAWLAANPEHPGQPEPKKDGDRD